jgi:hypothetical protein
LTAWVNSGAGVGPGRQAEDRRASVQIALTKDEGRRTKVRFIRVR